MNPRVKAVYPNSYFTLNLTFTDGSIRRFDMKPYLEIGVFRELRDVNLFNLVSPFSKGLNCYDGSRHGRLSFWIRRDNFDAHLGNRDICLNNSLRSSRLPYASRLGVSLFPVGYREGHPPGLLRCNIPNDYE